MASRRYRFLALSLSVSLCAAVPTAFAQDAAVKDAPPSDLNNDQQKMLDLINRGMQLDGAGKKPEAEAIYRRWIDDATQRYGADGLITSLGYRLLAGNLDDQNRFKEAEGYWKQLLDINRTTMGESDDDTLTAYAFLSSNYIKQGRPAEALPLRRKILAARTATKGESDPKTIVAMNNLAGVMSELGDMPGAEALYRKALAASLTVHGENHRETASTYGNLALVLRGLGRFDEAAPMLEKARTIDEALPGTTGADIALRHYNSAVNFSDMGRYAEAATDANKALDMWRAAKGDDSAEAALGYTAVAYSLTLEGRFGEADKAYRKALAIRTKLLGESHPLTAEAYNNLGLNMDKQGLPPSAIEPLVRKALDITRQSFGENSERTATTYGNVAHNLNRQGRYAEAEPMYRRALAIQERVGGVNHPSYATNLINLAYSLSNDGRPEAALPLMRQALGIFRAKFGDDNPETAWAYLSLGSTLGELGQHAEGAEMATKALEIRRRLLGENHPLTAVAYNSVGAALIRGGGDKGDKAAEPYLRQSLAILQHSVGEAHIDTAHAYNTLASNLLRQGKAVDAEQAAAKAVAILRRLDDQAAEGRNAVALAGLDRQKANPNRGIFTTYMNAAFGLMGETPGAAEQAQIQDRAFRAAQDAVSSASGRAVLQTAARGAAKTPQMAEAVRQEQDLAARANLIDKNLLRALGDQKPVEAARLRGELDGVQAELADVSALIDKNYPAYRQLVSPRPISIAEAKAALRPGEALLLMTEAANTFHLFVVTPDVVGWSRPGKEIDVILKQISDLRCDVDFATCSAARKVELDALAMSAKELEGHRRFDLNIANALYKQLIEPIEPLLKNTTRLYVTSSGKLGDLPLSMLSTTPLPAGADLADPDTLARAGWLADRYAFTSLPSVAALTLTRETKTGRRDKSFRGYGAPVLLGGDTGARAAAAGIGVFDGVSEAGSPLADPDALRKLAPLPGTKVELAAMANLFGASPSSLTLDGKATEAALRQDAALSTSNVIAIATHGLLPDPELGLGEPGLVLTPPTAPSDEDDGLLTATEAARLTLSADWVILSACNTASAENSGGGDSLSALARGFLYAGAEALLASHWRVSDEATAVLTVETLMARQANPDMSRAQALQLGMKAVRGGKRADGTAIAGWKADWAHPAAWAAFTNIANRDD